MTYGKLCSEFYDIDKPEAPPDALDFYMAAAERAEGPILEPMCGSGRFLLPLLARGFDIDGSDSSPHMLAACRAQAEHRNLQPKLREERLDALTPAKPYGLIFIASGSFSLLTDEGVVKESLARIHSVLAPGGRFLCEVERRDPNKPSELSGTWGGRWVTRPDGARLMISWLSQYWAPSGIVNSVHRYELIRDGRLVEQEFEDFALKLYDLDEIRGLFSAAGFSEIRLLSAYSGEPVNERDGEGEDGIVVSCIRPK